MGHSLYLRKIFGVIMLVFVVTTVMFVVPQKAHAADFGCGSSAYIVSNGITVGKVTKACIGGTSYAYVESYISPTQSIAAWLLYPNNTGQTYSNSGQTTIASVQQWTLGYPACGAIATAGAGGSVCTAQ